MYNNNNLPVGLYCRNNTITILSCLCNVNHYEFCTDKPIKDIIENIYQLEHTINDKYNQIIRELAELNIVEIFNYEYKTEHNNIIEYLEFIHTKTKSCIIRLILRFVKEYYKKYYTNKSAKK